MTGWRKSSYSAYNGNCVEVWHTSSHSVGNGACVEVAWHTSSHSGYNNCTEVAQHRGRVLVRDSKAGPGGPVLNFSPAAWTQFLATIAAPGTKRQAG